MTILIVYDSYFGNTENVAQAIADALGSRGTIKAVRVGQAEPMDVQDVDVLIVGSPTRKFQATPAIVKFIDSIPANGLRGKKVSAFDTRISVEKTDSKFLKRMIKWFGYAAEPIAKKLEKKGGDLVVPPAGFFVEDTEGPMSEGELQRAAEWAQQF